MINKKVIANYFTSQAIENIIYNFKNRDISKEAMILYIEALINLGFTANV
jgi:hypothetical protein